MKRKRSNSFYTIAFWTITLALSPVFAVAQSSSWTWDKSLQVRELGESMYMPSAVAFDQDSERYYVVDTGKNRLVSFEREGKALRAFTANEKLRSPFDMVRMDNGQLWVVEKGRNSLTLIDIGAQKVQPHTLRNNGQLVFPDRVAESDGKLYVLDRASGMVLRLNEGLSVEQRYGCTDCSTGIADFVISDGQIFALDPRAKKIFRFEEDGNLVQEMDLGDEVDFPVSLDVGPSKFIYVLDRHQNKVFAYDDRGQFRYSFLGTGKAPGKVYFARQLRFDPWGRLCVVDEGNGRVEIFTR